MTISQIKAIGIKKAKQSICRFRISAIGFNKRGEFVGSSTNKPRFSRKGGGSHSELVLMNKYGRRLKTIFIFRINEVGDLLPIDPCETCATKAKELGIKIKSIQDI